MRKPKRYELAVDGHDMLESNYGEYVAHSDYLVLLESYEELLTDNAKMKQLLLHFLYHHQGASSVIGQPIRILFGMNDHEHMTDDQIAIAKQVQPCNTPTK